MLVAQIGGGLASQLENFSFAYHILKYSKYQHELKLEISICEKNKLFGLDLLELPDYEVIDLDFNERNLKKILTFEEVEWFINNGKSEEVYFIALKERIKGDIFSLTKKYPLLKMVHSTLLPGLKLKKQSRYISDFKAISAKKSVAVHVRRGDFLKLGWEDTEQYYKNAINFCEKKVPGAHFYFFTNDHKWAKETFGERHNFHYCMNMSGVYGGNYSDWEEFFCISECRYAILSSMSGYGAVARCVSNWERKREGFSVCTRKGSTGLPVVLIDPPILKENKRWDGSEPDAQRTNSVSENEIKALIKNGAFDEALFSIHRILIDCPAYDLNLLAEMIKLKYLCCKGVKDEFTAQECRRWLVHKGHWRDYYKYKDKIWLFVPKFPCSVGNWNGDALQKLAEDLAWDSEVWYLGGDDSCKAVGKYAKDTLGRETGILCFPFSGNILPSNVSLYGGEVITTCLYGIVLAKKKGLKSVYIDASMTEFHQTYFENMPYNIYFWLRHKYRTVNLSERGCYRWADRIVTRKKKIICSKKWGMKVINNWDEFLKGRW